MVPAVLLRTQVLHLCDPLSSFSLLTALLCLASFSKFLLQLLIVCAHAHGNQLFTYCVYMYVHINQLLIVCIYVLCVHTMCICTYKSVTYCMHVCTMCTHCVHMHMEIRGRMGVGSLLPPYGSKKQTWVAILAAFNWLLPDILTALCAEMLH